MLYGNRRCRCGCGKHITNWTQECFPAPPWDTPGLPDRRMDERCANHKYCAYRDDDSTYCSLCHVSRKCDCE